MPWGCLALWVIFLLANVIYFNAYTRDVYWDATCGRVETRYEVFGITTHSEEGSSGLGELYLEFVGPYPDEAKWQLDTSYVEFKWLRTSGAHSEFCDVAIAGDWLAREMVDSSYLDPETKSWLITSFLTAARSLEPRDADSYGNLLAQHVHAYQQDGKQSASSEDFPTITDFQAGRLWDNYDAT